MVGMGNMGGTPMQSADQHTCRLPLVGRFCYVRFHSEETKDRALQPGSAPLENRATSTMARKMGPQPRGARQPSEGVRPSR